MEKEVQQKIEAIASDASLKEGIDLKQIFNLEIAGLKLGNIISAAIVLIICLVIKAVIDYAMKKFFEKTGIKGKAPDIIKKVIDAIIIIYIVLITAINLGINTASLLVLITTLSIVIIMALNAIISNMAGGVEIIASKSYSPGDFIQVGNASGRVKDMTITHTLIQNMDGQVIVIPNKEIAASKIINNSTIPNTRMKISINVAYGSPVETVKKALVEAAMEEERLLKDPAPFALVNDFKESSIEFLLFYWAGNADARKCRPIINENILRKFEEYGIKIPFNQLDVTLKERKTE